MPISTPENLVSTYGNDPDHFHHVLEHFFVPAVEKSGFTAIRPLAQGSDVIHAEIIKNIEKADVVLCDISSLNANVFFELGIRTALNKPVCIVKDEVTTKIPFDTVIINHHTYASSLAPWTLASEIDKLVAHIKNSVERSAGQNPLWRYFGITRPAELPDKPHNANEQFELIRIQLDGLNRKLDEKEQVRGTALTREDLGYLSPSDIRPRPPSRTPQRENPQARVAVEQALRGLGVNYEELKWWGIAREWRVMIRGYVPALIVDGWRGQLAAMGLNNVHINFFPPEGSTTE